MCLIISFEIEEKYNFKKVGHMLLQTPDRLNYYLKGFDGLIVLFHFICDIWYPNPQIFFRYILSYKLLASVGTLMTQIDFSF